MGIKGFDPVSFQRHKGYETSADHLVINTDNAVKAIQQSMLWNTKFLNLVLVLTAQSNNPTDLMYLHFIFNNHSSI